MNTIAKKYLLNLKYILFFACYFVTIIHPCSLFAIEIIEESTQNGVLITEIDLTDRKSQHIDKTVIQYYEKKLQNQEVYNADLTLRLRSCEAKIQLRKQSGFWNRLTGDTSDKINECYQHEESQIFDNLNSMQLKINDLYKKDNEISDLNLDILSLERELHFLKNNNSSEDIIVYQMLEIVKNLPLTNTDVHELLSIVHILSDPKLDITNEQLPQSLQDRMNGLENNNQNLLKKIQDYSKKNQQKSVPHQKSINQNINPYHHITYTINSIKELKQSIEFLNDKLTAHNQMPPLVSQQWNDDFPLIMNDIDYLINHPEISKDQTLRNQHLRNIFTYVTNIFNQPKDDINQTENRDFNNQIINISDVINIHLIYLQMLDVIYKTDEIIRNGINETHHLPYNQSRLEEAEQLILIINQMLTNYQKSLSYPENKRLISNWIQSNTTFIKNNQNLFFNHQEILNFFLKLEKILYTLDQDKIFTDTRNLLLINSQNLNKNLSSVNCVANTYRHDKNHTQLNPITYLSLFWNRCYSNTIGSFQNYFLYLKETEEQLSAFLKVLSIRDWFSQFQSYLKNKNLDHHNQISTSATQLINLLNLLSIDLIQTKNEKPVNNILELEDQLSSYILRLKILHLISAHEVSMKHIFPSAVFELYRSLQNKLSLDEIDNRRFQSRISRIKEEMNIKKNIIEKVKKELLSIGTQLSMNNPDLLINQILPKICYRIKFIDLQDTVQRITNYYCLTTEHK